MNVREWTQHDEEWEDCWEDDWQEENEERFIKETEITGEEIWRKWNERH